MSIRQSNALETTGRPTGHRRSQRSFYAPEAVDEEGLFNADTDTDTSDIVFLYAANVDGDEVARIQLPVRIPHGFHSNRVRDTITAPPS